MEIPQGFHKLNDRKSCTKVSRNLFRNLALHQSLPDLSEPSPVLRNLLRNLLRNPVEPKASWNLHRDLVEPDLALHQSLSDLNWNLLRNPVECDLALHQSLPDLLRNLRNLLRNLVEPDPALALVHTGAILG